MPDGGLNKHSVHVIKSSAPMYVHVIIIVRLVRHRGTNPPETCQYALALVGLP